MVGLSVYIGRDSNSPTSHGTIERVITKDEPAGSTGVTVKATPENPRYEVNSQNILAP